MTSRVRRSSRTHALLKTWGLMAAVVVLPACAATKQVTESVKDDVEQVPVANQQVCAADNKTMQVAAESAMAMTGEYPASVDEMVTLGLLRQPSPGFDFAPTSDGAYVITPKPGGPCEGFTP